MKRRLILFYADFCRWRARVNARKSFHHQRKAERWLAREKAVLKWGKQ